MRFARVCIVAVLGVWLLLPSATSAQTAPTVNMNDATFAQPQITISAGQTVVWNNGSGNTHTVTADDGSFDSGDVNAGGQFSMEFDTPGTYAYFCNYHGGPGGVGMSGVIVVN